MFQAFLIVLREGFEAFLIVAIILGYLKISGKTWLRSAVFLAIGLSVILSVALGWVLSKGVNQALWEGVLGVVTIVMVGSLAVHMWRAAPRMKRAIEEHLEKKSITSNRIASFLAVFLFCLLMIVREGMETALMLLQVREGDVLLGVLLGLSVALFISWLWAHYSHLINLKRFFQVTGVFLILFMIQVAIYSFHEFSEAGLLPRSEFWHETTEPFSPYGAYGQWFPIVMVGSCILWLIAGAIIDSRRKNATSVQASATI